MPPCPAMAGRPGEGPAGPEVHAARRCRGHRRPEGDAAERQRPGRLRRVPARRPTASGRRHPQALPADLQHALRSEGLSARPRAERTARRRPDARQAQRRDWPPVEMNRRVGGSRASRHPAGPQGGLSCDRPRGEPVRAPCEGRVGARSGNVLWVRTHRLRRPAARRATRGRRCGPATGRHAIRRMPERETLPFLRSHGPGRGPSPRMARPSGREASGGAILPAASARQCRAPAAVRTVRRAVHARPRARRSPVCGLRVPGRLGSLLPRQAGAPSAGVIRDARAGPGSAGGDDGLSLNCRHPGTATRSSAAPFPAAASLPADDADAFACLVRACRQA